MYVKSVEEKLTSALQASPAVTHAQILEGLEHQERLGLLDTVREMQRNGLLKRDLTERDERGKPILRYIRVG
jgi:hypothetical protein